MEAPLQGHAAAARGGPPSPQASGAAAGDLAAALGSSTPRASSTATALGSCSPRASGAAAALGSSAPGRPAQRAGDGEERRRRSKPVVGRRRRRPPPGCFFSFFEKGCAVGAMRPSLSGPGGLGFNCRWACGPGRKCLRNLQPIPAGDRSMGLEYLKKSMGLEELILFPYASIRNKTL